MDPNLNLLPPELIFVIFNYLNILDIVKLTKVSKFWYDLINDTDTWQFLTINRLKSVPTDFGKQLNLLIDQYQKTRSTYLMYDINRFYFSYVTVAHKYGIATPGLEYILQNNIKASYLAGRSGGMGTINYFFKTDSKTTIRALASHLNLYQLTQLLGTTNCHRYRYDIIIGLAMAGDIPELMAAIKYFTIRVNNLLIIDLLHAIVEGGGCGVYGCQQYGVANEDSYQSYLELLSFYPNLENQIQSEMTGIGLQCCNREIVQNLINIDFINNHSCYNLINKVESIKILHDLYPQQQQFIRIAYNILLGQVNKAPIISNFIQIPIDILTYIFSKVEPEIILDLALTNGNDKLSYLILSNFPIIELDLTMLIVALSLPMSTKAIFNNCKLVYSRYLWLLANVVNFKTINQLYITLSNKFGVNKVIEESKYVNNIVSYVVM